MYQQINPNQSVNVLIIESCSFLVKFANSFRVGRNCMMQELPM